MLQAWSIYTKAHTPKEGSHISRKGSSLVRKRKTVSGGGGNSG